MKSKKVFKIVEKVICGITALTFSICAILPFFSPKKAYADVVDDDVLDDVIFNDYYRHPLGGFSLSCSSVGESFVNVFDCPATYGGLSGYFSNRADLSSFTAWQNTQNATFSVTAKMSEEVFAGDVIFQLVGLNVALVREHISFKSWTFGTGGIPYDLKIVYKPIYSRGEESEDFYNFTFTPAYFYEGQYKFYWFEVFENMPPETFSTNGTALFDYICIMFIAPADYEEEAPSLVFANQGVNNQLFMSQYAGRINALYGWIYNGSPIETILSFPIDFLKTEIFPDFSFGSLLLIALGVLIFGFALKIALGG